MATRVKLSDGSELVVQASLEQWESAFRKALSSNGVLEIELPDGSIKPVDPRSVASFREEPEAAEALAQQFPKVAAS